jgi:hypothetical protein
VGEVVAGVDNGFIVIHARDPVAARLSAAIVQQIHRLNRL